MALAARLIGVLMTGLGIVVLAAPGAFMNLADASQTQPAIYVAAAIRLVIGVVLYLAAPRSRAPRLLRVIGIIIFAAGLLTPFVGVWFGSAILEWWRSGGEAIVRIWTALPITLGVLLIYLLSPVSEK
jgi:hypothetical protein